MAASTDYKLFIVWSGPISKGIMLALKKFIPLVIPSVSVFASPDIKKGQNWFRTLLTELKLAKYGIICITSENLYAPWIFFESGVLSQKSSQPNVAPLMIGVSDSILPAPLTEYQLTQCTKEDIRQLIGNINEGLKSKSDPIDTISSRFEKDWPEVERAMKKAIRSSRLKLNKVMRSVATGKPEDTLVEISKISQQVKGLISAPRIIEVTKNQAKKSPVPSTSRQMTSARKKYLPAIWRMERLAEILKKGGPTNSAWRTDPSTEEYRIMKEAEQNDSIDPLTSGELVVVQRHVPDNYNGKTGKVTGTWKEKKHHYNIRFWNNDGSTESSPFHVMYLTRASIVDSHMRKK